MLAYAVDIKIIAKMGADNCLPFEIRQACVFVGLLYGAVNCGSLNKLRTENVIEKPTFET